MILNNIRNLLWLDCTAAGVAGLLVLAISPWLAPLYELTQSRVVALALVNLLYASFSFTLARNPGLRSAWVYALAAANVAWACLLVFLSTQIPMSRWGLAHFLGEALFVGGLGLLELRAQKQRARQCPQKDILPGSPVR
jgi:hypothetical protein